MPTINDAAPNGLKGFMPGGKIDILSGEKSITRRVRWPRMRQRTNQQAPL